MPVTIKPSTHGASLVSFPYQQPAKNAREILGEACQQDHKECLELLQSSFDAGLPSTLYSSDNGFVKSVIQAYSKHHHLRIRPEDVWFAILAQLSTYINKHAEELRGQFVAHEGKKELVIVYGGGNRYTADFGVFAEQMKDMIQDYVVDPDLKDWMMPAFSTTTEHDTVIASILMMGAMQTYFSYKCVFCCGLPSVTLLGEKADWELILRKLDKLTSLGHEPTQFSELLRPIITRFIRSFDSPADEEVISFWQRIVGITHQMSGSTIYSGWITAFCFWDDDGNSLHKLHDWYRPYLCLDGVSYHKLDSTSVPSSCSRVPVKVDDHGYCFDAVLIAGSVGINCTSSGEEVGGNGVVGLDTVNAETGWWIFEKKAESRPDPESAGQSPEPAGGIAIRWHKTPYRKIYNLRRR